MRLSTRDVRKYVIEVLFFVTKLYKCEELTTPMFNSMSIKTLRYHFSDLRSGFEYEAF